MATPSGLPSDSFSPVPQKSRICRYFGHAGDCRAGASCSFIHDSSKFPGSSVGPSTPAEALDSMEESSMQYSRQAVRTVPASRVVARPISKAQIENPREYQLGQIRRRFAPKETRPVGVQDGTVLLKFGLTPSDPDFPFELTALQCALTVPAGYPSDKPTLRVSNTDIPRGFAINVENGFDALVAEKNETTLLELMKGLDKNLEVFLSAQKVDTVKIVANKDTRHLVIPSRPLQQVAVSTETLQSFEKHSAAPIKPVEYFTQAQKEEASRRRETESRILEARMGRLPLFKKSGDGIVFTLPVEPRRRAELPVSIRAVKAVRLFVPLLYPLHACRIQLEGVEGPEAKAVEGGFEQKAISSKELNLMAHINSLTQSMHILAKTAPEIPKCPSPVVQQPAPSLTPIVKGKESAVIQDDNKSHIQYISRPPEWTINPEDEEEGQTDYGTDSEDSYSYDTGDESDDDGGAQLPPQPLQNVEKGTAISFPELELYGVELLELSVLNITVKCERCKDLTEVKGLKNGVAQTQVCRKCTTPLSVCFRRDFVHANAVRAGFLDMEGCVVGDMLASSFIPTCSNCSTAYPSPGLSSTRGDTVNNICRECHQKFSFKLPTIKFLRITSSHLPPSLPRRRPKETLGLVPGTALPKRGLCRHYGKSYRWFRFSCCEKVYACDRCHDEQETHPNEWANRHICGWCSREGNYRPEDCGSCHGRVVGRKGGGGFWEGGKGTRDQVKMSRKDPRKYTNKKIAKAKK